MYAQRAFEPTAYRFGEVYQFGQPITISVHCSDTDVIGLKHETLRLWYRSGIGGPRAILGEPVRTPSASPAQCAGYDVSGKLSFTMTHFTQVMLFAEGAHKVYLPLIRR